MGTLKIGDHSYELSDEILNNLEPAIRELFNGAVWDGENLNVGAVPPLTCVSLQIEDNGKHVFTYVTPSLPVSYSVDRLAVGGDSEIYREWVGNVRDGGWIVL